MAKYLKSAAVVLTALIITALQGMAQSASPAAKPAAPPAAAAAPAPTTAEAKQVIAKITNAMGGADKLKAVHAVRIKSGVDAVTPQGEFNIDMEQTVIYPDQAYTKLATPMGDITLVNAPSGSFIVTPNGTQDMAGDQKDEMLKEQHRDEIWVIQHSDDPKYSFTVAGTAKVGTVQAQMLDVVADGDTFRWFVDSDTGRVVRSSAHIVDMMGTASDQLLDFTEWKDFGGIPFPTKVKITRDGQNGGSVTIDSVEINPTVDQKVFARPQ